MRARLLSAVLAVVISAGALTLGTARPAQAARRSQENLYRYLTYGLGGLTIYGAVRKNPTIALIGAAGTYLAYRKWKDEIRHRHHARIFRSRRHFRHFRRFARR